MQAAAKRWLPFEKARELVRKAGLTSKKEWQQWCRDGHRPSNIPSNPDVTYSDKGWLSWRDWLGYGEGLPPVGTFQPFVEARKVGLEGTEEWEAWCGDGHRPYDILSRRHEQGRGVGCRGRSGWARAKRCEADAFFSGSSEGSHTHTRTHTHALSHNQDAPGTPSPP